ncbi:MAG TPA: restriction endonuclease [Anaerolineales bacterium]|jgi:restriction system protein|nr:restriction endonuclease [Anaerolineales bacterium]
MDNPFTLIICSAILLGVGLPILMIVSRIGEAYRRAALRAAKEDAKDEAKERALAIKKVKAQAYKDKEEKSIYFENRLNETEKLNQNLAKIISGLENILPSALSTRNDIIFKSLYNHDDFPELELPSDLKKTFVLTSRDDYLSKIHKPSLFEKAVPGWEQRHQKRLQNAELRYKEYEEDIAKRDSEIAVLTQKYESKKTAFSLKIQQHNQEIDEFEKDYINGIPAAVERYCLIILENSLYPDSFPKHFKVAYVPEPKELVVEYELPTKEIVPAVAEYKYIKTRDAIDEKLRKMTDIKELYQEIVAGICLRTLHELFEADRKNHLDVVVFNGFVQTVDPATGKDVRPYLISIRTIKEKFNEINIAKVDKRICLRNLGAQVSPQPDELMAVKPVVNFDMFDKRFINESDVISELDTKPNLMDLNPFEFENLVNNLFSKIGFEAKLTRSSRDGGIDVVAFDPRPILGGKVVVQAKRYKNVVGVESVRDLYGSMMNERAGKGILVTTSHYGTDAYNFAKDKPIELIDGGGLLYLLEQNGIKAKIIFPQE